MMNTNEKPTWYKWDYLCTNCDSNIVMIIKSEGLPHAEMCPKCCVQMTLMSVVDATIYPTKKEETMELTTDYNPNLLVTYKVITDGETTYETRKMNELEWDMEQFRKLRKAENNWWGKESQLRNLISDVYQDSPDQETLLQIADIFGIPLTKTIEYIATINVSGTMEVDLTDTYDLSDMLFSNLNVSGYGEVEVLDFDVYSVEEC